ncbi:MAG: response regulator containing CheY-like receiver and domain [Paenibacillus sp.]|nr:response regulator containing CheY-like receiver and domain [Paenibacillus sp.]
MSYKTLLVEDEKKLLAYMQNKLTAFPEFDIRGSYDVPEEALSAFEELLPDVVFLDIQLPRISGLALAEQLLRIHPSVKIVFLTAYDQYALDAFRVEAIDYILKPIRGEDIDRVLQRLKKLLPTPVQSYSPVIRCIGAFEVMDADGQAVKWPTKKTEELFAYLWAHRGQQINKWTLVELLWPDQLEEKSIHSLYTAVYRVKQVLQRLSVPVSVERTNEAYRLTVKERISDLEELLWLAEDPSHVENAPHAADLYLNYRQPLFGGRGYGWSATLEAAAERAMHKLGRLLLDDTWKRNDRDQLGAVLDTVESRQKES